MDSIVTEESDRVDEEKKVQEALTTCGYPKWTFDKVKEQRQGAKPKKKNTTKKDDNTRSRGMVVLPYVKGVTERVSRIMRNHNISTAMKPHNTLRNQLVHPKDKREPKNITNAIYEIPCLNCNSTYIGETGRKFGKRLTEHKTEVDKVDQTGVNTRAGRLASQSETHKSAVTDHVVDNNHVIGWKEAKVIGTEGDRYKRWVKEAIEIRKRKGTTMNRDEGQYQLSHIFNKFLQNEPRTATSSNSGNTGNTNNNTGKRSSGLPVV